MFLSILAIFGSTFVISASTTAISTVVKNRKEKKANQASNVDESTQETKPLKRSIRIEKKNAVEQLKGKLDQLEQDNQNIEDVISRKLDTFKFKSNEYKQLAKTVLKKNWDKIYQGRKAKLEQLINNVTKASTIDEINEYSLKDYTSQDFINSTSCENVIERTLEKENISTISSNVDGLRTKTENLEEQVDKATAERRVLEAEFGAYQEKTNEKLEELESALLDLNKGLYSFEEQHGKVHEEERKSIDDRFGEIIAKLTVLDKEFDTQQAHTNEELKHLQTVINSGLYALEEQQSVIRKTQNQKFIKIINNLQKKLEQSYDYKLKTITQEFLSRRKFSEFKNGVSEILSSNVALNESTLKEVQKILIEIGKSQKITAKISSEIEKVKGEVDKRLTSQDQQISRVEAKAERLDDKLGEIIAKLTVLDKEFDTQQAHTNEELKHLQTAITSGLYALEEQQGNIHAKQQKELEKKLDDMQEKLRIAYDKQLKQLSQDFLTTKNFTEFKKGLDETLDGNVQFNKTTLKTIERILSSIESSKKLTAKTTIEIQNLKEKIERRVTKQDVARIVKENVDARLSLSESKIKKIETTIQKLIESSNLLKKQFKANETEFVTIVTQIVSDIKVDYDINNDEILNKIAEEVAKRLSIQSTSTKKS